VVLISSFVFIQMRGRQQFQRVPVEEYPDPNETIPLGRPMSAFTDGNRYSAASEMSGLGRPVSHACMCPPRFYFILFVLTGIIYNHTPQSRIRHLGSQTCVTILPTTLKKSLIPTSAIPWTWVNQ
jgi:hypothetical protein